MKLYEFQNENFNFGTTKTLNLHTRSIFQRGSPKFWSKKIFIAKTLSKLGALTVHTVYYLQSSHLQQSAESSLLFSFYNMCSLFYLQAWQFIFLLLLVSIVMYIYIRVYLPIGLVANGGGPLVYGPLFKQTEP